MPGLQPDSEETCRLLDQAGRGDRQALGRLLEGQRSGLNAFVALHLDAALRGRLDPSDAVQEAQLEVVRRLDDFLRRRPMPFRLWVRRTAYQRLLNLRRDHRLRARRSVDREVALPDRSSLLLARPLLGDPPSPSEQAQAREFAERVSRAVAELAEDDREILLMRHAEELPSTGSWRTGRERAPEPKRAIFGVPGGPGGRRLPGAPAAGGAARRGGVRRPPPAGRWTAAAKPEDDRGQRAPSDFDSPAAAKHDQGSLIHTGTKQTRTPWLLRRQSGRAWVRQAARHCPAVQSHAPPRSTRPYPISAA
jgi:RNA polymerase sigma-70 factor, ECF subfamily